MSEGIKVPVWFWIVSVLALLWNLMGVGAYLFEALSSPEGLAAQYSEREVAAVLARPAWATGVFAIAVFGGAIGCLGLLLRKEWAKWPLILSLLAVIIQQVYIWGMTDTASHMSGAAWIMPIMIPVVALLLVLFARKGIIRGWLR